MEVAILFGMVIALLAVGVPIAVALGLSSTLFLLVLSDSSLASVAQSLYQAMAGHYTLLAIPFFILASSFMSTGGVARRIIDFAIAIIGHVRGGLAIAGVYAFCSPVRLISRNGGCGRLYRNRRDGEVRLHKRFCRRRHL